jgi:hypothetical protein
MYASMNNPWTSPEQFEYNGPKLDPEYDDMPEEKELFVAVTSEGVRYEAWGEDGKEELIEWLEDNEETFTFTN